MRFHELTNKAVTPKHPRSGHEGILVPKSMLIPNDLEAAHLPLYSSQPYDPRTVRSPSIFPRLKSQTSQSLLEHNITYQKVYLQPSPGQSGAVQSRTGLQKLQFSSVTVAQLLQGPKHDAAQHHPTLAGLATDRTLQPSGVWESTTLCIYQSQRPYACQMV